MLTVTVTREPKKGLRRLIKRNEDISIAEAIALFLDNDEARKYGVDLRSRSDEHITVSTTTNEHEAIYVFEGCEQAVDFLSCVARQFPIANHLSNIQRSGTIDDNHWDSIVMTHAMGDLMCFRGCTDMMQNIALLNAYNRLRLADRIAIYAMLCEDRTLAPADAIALAA